MWRSKKQSTITLLLVALHLIKLKKIPLILLTLLMAKAAFSQQSLPDSIFNKTKVKFDSANAIRKADSLQAKLNSSQNKWNNKLDSLRSLGNLEKYKDSLKVIGWADSLKNKVSTTLASKQNALQSKIDSLLVRNQPTLPFQRKIDSLQKKQQALLTEIDSKQNQLQQKLNARYKKWGSRLDSLGLKAPTFTEAASGKPNTQALLTNTKLPNTALANASGAGLNAQIPNLSTKDFASLDFSKDLKNVGGKLSVPGTDQMKQWNNELKNVSQPMKDVTEKLGEAKGVLKDPSKAAEGAVGQLGDVKSLSKEMGNADKLMKDNEAMKTAEMMKDPEKLKEEAAKKAIDHFAGKEEVLKQAMDQMAKIKKKVPSLESLDKLPKNYKWPKNGLKGKPFRERVRFGLNFSLQSKRDTIIIDLFPNASYNLTGRIELGLGLIYRLRESTKSWQFDQSNPVWGFNLFGTFKTFKSVRMRLETDAASYPKVGGSGEPIQRQWRWTWLTGVQTEFKISQHFVGNVQMLYNFDKSITAGFPEQLVLRFGVQYKLLAKKPLAK
jgi:hypothetical protein